MQKPFAVVTIVLGICAGAASSAQAASSQPPEVQAHVARMKADCKEAGGRPARSPGLVQAADLTGDGQVDYVVHEGAFVCNGAASYFSGGAGGASVNVYVSDAKRHARNVFTHGADDIRLERKGHSARLWLGVGGELCGQKQPRSRADAEACWRPLEWKGGQMDFAPLQQVRPYSAFSS